MNSKPRVLIADSHQFVADACKQMLEPEYQVAGVVADGRALVRVALQLKPDVIILEVTLPQLSGIDAASQLKHKMPSVKIVFLTATSDVNAVAEAFRSGAAAYVLKLSGATEFINAMRRVMRGESYLSPLIARETIDYLLHQPKRKTVDQTITRREAEILQLLTEGRSMKDTAGILGIAPNTVAFHKYKMMERLGIDTNAGLLQYAMSRHMTPADGVWRVTDSTGTRILPPSGETKLRASCNTAQRR